MYNMLRKPVPVTKNNLLNAIRTQRKSQTPIKWIVIGLMREDVPPTALILDQRLITEQQWYDPSEYDVIERINNYDLFSQVRQLKTQTDVVEHIYTKSIRWQKWRRDERKSLEQEPIRTLLANNSINERIQATKGVSPIKFETNQYDKGTFRLDTILNRLENYQFETDTDEQEDYVLFSYSFDKPVSTNRNNIIFEISAKVNDGELDKSSIDFTWVYKKSDEFEGIPMSTIKKDPFYLYIQGLKEGY